MPLVDTQVPLPSERIASSTDIEVDKKSNQSSLRGMAGIQALSMLWNMIETTSQTLSDENDTLNILLKHVRSHM